jgi:hypothetical protein
VASRVTDRLLYVVFGILWPMIFAALFMLAAVLSGDEPIRVPLLVYFIAQVWIVLMLDVLGAFVAASVVGVAPFQKTIESFGPARLFFWTSLLVAPTAGLVLLLPE